MRALPTCMKVQSLTTVLGAALLCVATSVNGTAQTSTQMPAVRSEAGSNRVAVPGSAVPTDISQPIITASTRRPQLLAIADAAPVSAGEYLVVQPVATGSGARKAERPSIRQIHAWEALLVAQHSAAIFDAWSTRQAITSGNGYERNPLMKPFVNSAAIYPMLQIAPSGVDFLSHRFMNSNHVLLRRTWWLPQTVSIAASLWCGSRNLHVANLRR